MHIPTLTALSPHQYILNPNIMNVSNGVAMQSAGSENWWIPHRVEVNTEMVSYQFVCPVLLRWNKLLCTYLPSVSKTIIYVLN